METLQWALLTLTALLGLPVIWFAVQVFVACLKTRQSPQSVAADAAPPLRVAILVPAHNESVHLLPTLNALMNSTEPTTRVLVVADNCTDDTAEHARQTGAEVIERNNPLLRGKGYALDYGIQHLKQAPPDVLIIMDADCLPQANAMRAIAMQAYRRGRPVQALYLMHSNGNGGLRSKIAQFAWCVKNLVRPRGLHWLGLPCQLTGSGMAFPWRIIEQVSLANGHLVEDMQLGMALIANGQGAIFMEDAVVSSHFPSQEEGVRSQRTRWEHGHLMVMLNEGFPRLWQGLLRGNMTLVGMALDICIPPLALLVLLLLAWTGLMTLVAIFTALWLPLAFCIALLGLLAGAVLAAWANFGRKLVSMRELLCAPLYALGKLPVYASFLFRRQSAWVRSRRDGEQGD